MSKLKYVFKKRLLDIFRAYIFEIMELKQYTFATKYDHKKI